jgi:hypothetical protein
MREVLIKDAKTFALQNKIPSPQTWVVRNKANKMLTLVVTQCVLNQSQGYWLLFDAIGVAISMCCMMENYNYGVIIPI